MELIKDAINETPRPAASVVLLRDGNDNTDTRSPQVYLQRRHADMKVLGGACVFPGGKVDADDHDPRWLPWLDVSAAQMHEQLNEPHIDTTQAVALYVAAIRELWEETGVWLGPASIARDTPWGAWLEQTPPANGERWLASSLVPWSRWITPRQPSVMRHRFDTRFFVARLPHGQEALHDNRESTDGLWLGAREALDRYWRREIELAAPQIMTLVHLSRFDSTVSIWDEGINAKTFTIEPAPHDLDGTRVVCYPGDPLHPDSMRAMPGPLRLMFMGDHFEPPGGFEAFFRDTP